MGKALTALDPIELAIELMQINSTSGDERAIVSHVSHLLGQRGWRLVDIPVGGGRSNIFAASVDAPAVTLSTHLDTVPPFIPPRIDGTRLWGRGACDAKGIAAAMICAAERLRAADIPVALLFVVGEETSHDGARSANAFPATSRVLINGEPTESHLAVGTKGVLRLVVRTHGVAAHSAYPHMGHSAIDDLVRLLDDLTDLELPYDDTLGETTVNVGIISGGVADNVVAAEAAAHIMVRLVRSADEMWRILHQWASGRATLEEGISVPCVHLRTVEGFPTSVVAYATDIPELTNWGTPYLFGPGSILNAHRDDEHIELAELRAAVGEYELLALAALRAA